MHRLTISLLVLIGFLFCFNASSFAAPAIPSGTASFLGTDTITLGNWQGTYGTVGYYIPSGPSSTPSDGSTFNPGAASLWTWGTNVVSTSALKTSGGNIASAWYNNLGTSAPSLTLDVIVPSGSQTVALYLLDYDQKGRSESVAVTDASDNPLDGPHAVNNFTNGQYLSWTISGEVHINITLVNGPNAVASGIFFGGNSSMPPPVSTGAYLNHSLSTISSAGGVQVNKLTLPAGTYLIHFAVNAVPDTPTNVVEELLCFLSPTNLDFSQNATAPPIAGFARINLSAADRLTLTVPGPVTATCEVSTGHELEFESVLEAIPVPSITIQ